MIMPYFFWAPVFSQYDQLNKDLSYDNRRTDIIHYLQKIMNELITNNNNLSDYIQQEINKMSSGIDGKVAALERFYVGRSKPTTAVRSNIKYCSSVILIHFAIMVWDQLGVIYTQTQGISVRIYKQHKQLLIIKCIPT